MYVTANAITIVPPYHKESSDLFKTLTGNPGTTSVVQVTGDSMLNAFIPPGALLLVDRSVVPENGDIIVAVVDGHLVVRFFKENKYKRWLVPANSKYRDMEIRPETNFQVHGVVTRVITDTKNLRQYMW